MSVRRSAVARAPGSDKLYSTGVYSTCSIPNAVLWYALLLALLYVSVYALLYVLVPSLLLYWLKAALLLLYGEVVEGMVEGPTMGPADRGNERGGNNVHGSSLRCMLARGAIR